MQQLSAHRLAVISDDALDKKLLAPTLELHETWADTLLKAKTSTSGTSLLWLDALHFAVQTSENFA